MKDGAQSRRRVPSGSPVTARRRPGPMMLVCEPAELADGLSRAATSRGVRPLEVVRAANGRQALDIAEQRLDRVGRIVVGIVLSSLDDPRRLGALSETARSQGGAIVVAPVGMAPDEEAALEAIGRQHGIAAAPDVDVLLDVCAALTYGCPTGSRVGLVTRSAIIARDMARLAARRGLELPALAGKARALATISQNPIVIAPRGGARRVAAALRSPGGLDIVALVGESSTAEGRALATALRAARPTLTVVLAEVPSDGAPPSQTAVVRGGGPLIDALRVLQEFGRYIPGQGDVSSAVPRDRATAQAIVDGPPRALSEPSSKRALSPYGIPFPVEALATSPSMAERLARSMKPPLVAKIASPDLPDKLGGRGIVEGIENAPRLRAAYHALTSAASHDSPTARILGVLVGQQTTGMVAVAVRAEQHPRLGPLIRLGAGRGDRPAPPESAMLLLPARPGHIERLIDSAPVSRAYRDRIDRAALVDVVTKLAAFVTDFAAQVSTVELDPIMLRPAGQGAVAADARVVVSAPPPGDLLAALAGR